MMMKFLLVVTSAAAFKVDDQIAPAGDGGNRAQVIAATLPTGGSAIQPPGVDTIPYHTVQANVSKRTLAMQMSSSDCSKRCSSTIRPNLNDLVKAAGPFAISKHELMNLYTDFDKLCKSGCNGKCCEQSNLETGLKSNLKNDPKSKADYISILKLACKMGKNAIQKDELCSTRFNFLTFDPTPLKEAATPYLTSEKNLMYDLWSFFLHGCGSPKNLEQCTTIAGAKYDELTSIGDMSHVKKNSKEDYENILKLACRVGKGEGEMRGEWMRAELERAWLERLKCLGWKSWKGRCSTSKLQSLVDAAKPLMRDTTNLAAHISRGCLDACRNSNACTFDGNSDVKDDNTAKQFYKSIINLACKTGNNTIQKHELCITRYDALIFHIQKSLRQILALGNVKFEIPRFFIHGCDAPKEPEQCTTIADNKLKVVADAKEDDKIILKLACRVGKGETPIVGFSGELKCLRRCSTSKLQSLVDAAKPLMRDTTNLAAHISRGCLGVCKNSNACTFDGNSDVKDDNTAKADYKSIINLACKTGNNTIHKDELCRTRFNFLTFDATLLKEAATPYLTSEKNPKWNNMDLLGFRDVDLWSFFLHGCDAPKEPEQCTTIAGDRFAAMTLKGWMPHVKKNSKEDYETILKLACRVGKGEGEMRAELARAKLCLTRCSTSKLQLWARTAHSLLKDPTETVAPNHKIAKEMIDSTLLEKCKAACHSTSTPDCSELAKNLDQTDSRAMHLVQDGSKDCFKSIIKGACELGSDNRNTPACNWFPNRRKIGDRWFELQQVNKTNCRCGDQLAVCGQWCLDRTVSPPPPKTKAAARLAGATLAASFVELVDQGIGLVGSNKSFSICADLPWKNCHGHTCKELTANLPVVHAKADWEDAKQLKAGKQCCYFGGGTSIDTSPCPSKLKDAQACKKVTGCKYTAAVAAVAGQAAECKFKASCSATTEEKCKAVTGCTFNQNKKKCEYPASPNFCKIDLTSNLAKSQCETKGCKFEPKVNGVEEVAAKCEK